MPHATALQSGAVGAWFSSGGCGSAVVGVVQQWWVWFSKSLFPCRERPVFSTKAHVFQIDPETRKKWIPSTEKPVVVSYYFDSNRKTHRIIAIEGNKVGSYWGRTDVDW